MNAVSAWRRTMKTSGPLELSRMTTTVDAGRGFATIGSVTDNSSEASPQTAKRRRTVTCGDIGFRRCRVDAARHLRHGYERQDRCPAARLRRHSEVEAE